jgi:hypothetical protein
MIMIKFSAIALSGLLMITCNEGSGVSSRILKENSCTPGNDCTVSGIVTMSTDGHGYIGRLVLQDGTCLNVSLPDDESKNMIYRTPRHMKITGRMLPYVKENNVVIRVNDRLVGEGLCGNYYLFVR